MLARRAIIAATLWWALPACTRVMGTTPLPRSPSSAEAQDGVRWIEAPATSARAGGAGAPIVVATGAGAPGDNLGGRIELPEDLCGLFLARGSPTIQDLDLFVYADDGAALAADETQEAGGSAIVCPPHPKHVYAFGRVAAGHGMFSVSAQTVRPVDATKAARAAGVPSLQEQAISSAGWPGLDDALAARRAELGGTWRDVRRVAIPMDPRIPTHVSSPIGAGQCLDILVLPAEEVAFAELTVLDSVGRIVGRAPNEGQKPAIVVCAPSRTQVTFELQPHAGRGMAALVLSMTSDRNALDSGVALVLREAESDRPLEDARAQLERSLGVAQGPRSLLVRGAAAIGRRESRDVELGAGCSRLDIVAGAPLRGVDAWLWSPTGALLAHDDGASQATLFPCGPAQRARLDVEAVTRSGPYALELRDPKMRSDLLEQQPLAASRLLGRLAEAGRVTALSDVGKPVAQELTPTALARHAVEVPPGSCADVTVAVGPGAEGVELRLLDQSNQDELAFVRGTYAAFSTVCALDRPAALHLGIETRTASGTARALLAVPLRAERIRH
jgi:hypothetical protein